MKGKSLTAAALALCLLAAAGCGGKKAKSPKDAAKNFVNSLLKNDKGLFLSSVYYGDADKELVEAQFERMAAAMTEFVVKSEKAYGTGKFKGTAPVMTEEDLANLQIEGSGDTAGARTSGGKDIKFIKKDGTWYVDISDFVPKGEQAA